MLIIYLLVSLYCVHLRKMAINDVMGKWHLRGFKGLFLRSCQLGVKKKRTYNTFLSRDTIALSLSCVSLVAQSLLQNNANPTRTSDVVWEGRDAWNLEGNATLQTNHHHHVNGCAPGRIIHPPPIPAPSPTPPPATRTGSSLLGLYKSPQSPVREHGGSSFSQVSERSAQAASSLSSSLTANLLHGTLFIYIHVPFFS